jgi:hypothetical protein
MPIPVNIRPETKSACDLTGNFLEIFRLRQGLLGRALKPETALAGNGACGTLQAVASSTVLGLHAAYADVAGEG